MVATNGMTTAIIPVVATRTEVEMEGVDTEEVNKTFSTAPVLITVKLSFCCELGGRKQSNCCLLKKILSPSGYSRGGYNQSRWGNSYRDGGSDSRSGYSRNQQSGGSYNRPAPYNKGGYNQVLHLDLTIQNYRHVIVIV